MKKLILLLFPFIFLFAHAQLKWPEITQVNKPWTRWWWQGSAVNKGDLSALMQTYQRAGLGGLEITPIYGVKGYEKQFIPYLSAEWINMLAHTLKEAKRLGLGIDMATGTGWPFGGPWITPEDACKNINLKTYDLKGGQRLLDTVRYLQPPMVRTVSGQQVAIQSLSYPIATNKDLQGFAFDQVKYEMPLPLVTMVAYSDKGGFVDLTPLVDTNGRLDWIAPEGNWTLYALFQGWHGKQVERAAPGGEGDVIDHFSVDALNTYLQHFDRAFLNADLSGLRSFFNDSYEVDDARGQANWTPELITAFQERRGYDLRLHLPALFQKDSADKNRRVISDYRQTVSELLLEKFTTPWHEWAKQKDKLVRNQSHGSPANILDLYAAIDIPETEGNDILRFKFATSAANVTGKPLASAEAATWLDEHFMSSLGDVKMAVDKFFVGGVNHIFYHGTNYSPTKEKWPGWLFYAAVHFTPSNTFWRNFSTLNNYIARCQSFLQAARPDNDILLYFPIHDRFAQPGNSMLHHFDGMEGFDNTTFKTDAEYMLHHGYAFDLISDLQLKHVTTSGSWLISGGNKYKTILIAETKYMPEETMARLMSLASEGATVIFHKTLPQDVPGFGNLHQRKKQLTESLAVLPFSTVESNGIKEASVGSGAVLLGGNLETLLTSAKIRKEKLTASGLQYIRKKNEEGNIYFITNPSKRFEGWVPLQTNAGAVYVFNPMTEAAGAAKSRQTTNGVEVYLALDSGESCILQITQVAMAGSAYQVYQLAGEAVAVNGTWSVKFLTGGPTLPAAVQLKAPGSWTEISGSTTKSFAGTAAYSTRFKRPSSDAAGWILDLGRVEESADVFLNNKKIATLIGPTYRVFLPAASLLADNLLRVEVTSGMANRIIDLEKKGVAWKKFYNINFPSKLPANRGVDGLFTAARWEPFPSGLIGPVTLTPARQAE